MSHVGSFPLEPDPALIEVIARGYLESGVDVPAYPQLRGFVEMFLEPFVEERILGRIGELYVVKDVGGLKGPPGLRPNIWEAKLFAEVARNTFLHLRAPVTGAFTLASRILLAPKTDDLSSTALSDARIVEALADYVRNTLKLLADMGYNVLFVDEPVLSVVVGAKKVLLGYSVDDIVDYLNYVHASTVGESGVHVCGRVSRLLFRTLASVEKLNIINLEFHDARENIHVIDGELLKTNSKKLAPGIASSRSLEVESVDELLHVLREIVNRAGLNVDLVSADNGFGGLRGMGPRDKLLSVCFAKLRRIKEAVNKLLEDVSVY